MPKEGERKNSFLADIAGGIPFIGGAISGAIQRGQSRRDIREQREYNHPRNELERLYDAGLPMAYLTGGGQGGSSTSLPETTDYGGKQIGQNQIVSAQIKILQEELRLKRAEADIKEDERDWRIGESPFSRDEDVSMGYTSNQQTMLSSQRAMQLASSIMKDQEQQLYAWENMARKEWVKTGKFTDEMQARLDQLLVHNRLWNQTYRNTEMEVKARQTLINELSKNGMNFWEALMFTLSSGGSRIPFIGN